MTSDKLRIIVIDDEKDIRNALVETINEAYDMEVVGQAGTVSKAFELISECTADAIFLDIKLIGGDAFQLLNMLKRKNIEIPPVIINTGFDDFEFAQKAHNEFKDIVIMILRKPFWEHWEEKEDLIIKKILESDKESEQVVRLNGITIKSDGVTYILRHEELILMESDVQKKGRGRIVLHTPNGIHTINKSLRSIENDLPSNFLRISRFAMINVHCLDRIDHGDQMIYLRGLNKGIGYGNAYKADIMKLLD